MNPPSNANVLADMLWMFNPFAPSAAVALAAVPDADPVALLETAERLALLDSRCKELMNAWRP